MDIRTILDSDPDKDHEIMPEVTRDAMLAQEYEETYEAASHARMVEEYDDHYETASNASGGSLFDELEVVERKQDSLGEMTSDEGGRSSPLDPPEPKSLKTSELDSFHDKVKSTSCEGEVLQPPAYPMPARLSNSPFTIPPCDGLIMASGEDENGQRHVLRVQVNNHIKYLMLDERACPWNWYLPTGSELRLPPIGSDPNIKCYRAQVINAQYEVIFPQIYREEDLPVPLDSVQGVAHDKILDISTFELVCNLEGLDEIDRLAGRRMGARHPDFQDYLVMKLVEFPECLPFPTPYEPERACRRQYTRTQMMENEIYWQEKVAELGLAPKIEALVTEAGRGIIGFVTKWIPGNTIARLANECEELPRVELDKVDAALEALHEAGICHNDLNDHNIVRVTGDGSIMFINFEYACERDEESIEYDLECFKEAMYWHRVDIEGFERHCKEMLERSNQDDIDETEQERDLYADES
ncbi:hypothetical protein BX600DRAFT_441178 [Xylariales sp. PMI_506]|nr:hypothetical protein BX600DRAFT_441178 [Xylariales sp. PMI_506]